MHYSSSSSTCCCFLDAERVTLLSDGAGFVIFFFLFLVFLTGELTGGGRDVEGGDDDDCSSNFTFLAGVSASGSSCDAGRFLVPVFLTSCLAGEEGGDERGGVVRVDVTEGGGGAGCSSIFSSIRVFLASVSTGDARRFLGFVFLRDGLAGKGAAGGAGCSSTLSSILVSMPGGLANEGNGHGLLSGVELNNPRVPGGGGAGCWSIFVFMPGGLTNEGNASGLLANEESNSPRVMSDGGAGEEALVSTLPISTGYYIVSDWNGPGNIILSRTMSARRQVSPDCIPDGLLGRHQRGVEWGTEYVTDRERRTVLERRVTGIDIGKENWRHYC